jgi:hypothetical protein
VTFSTPRAIRPSAFSNLFVELSIKNPQNAELATERQSDRATERLEFFGATIVKGTIVDVILTDGPLFPSRCHQCPTMI